MNILPWILGGLAYIIIGFHMAKIAWEVAENWNMEYNDKPTSHSITRMTFFPFHWFCNPILPKAPICDFSYLFYATLLTIFWPLKIVWALLVFLSVTAIALTWLFSMTFWRAIKNIFS